MRAAHDLRLPQPFSVHRSQDPQSSHLCFGEKDVVDDSFKLVGKVCEFLWGVLMGSGQLEFMIHVTILKVVGKAKNLVVDIFEVFVGDRNPPFFDVLQNT